ncbi:MAG: alpha/beta hydrolase fold domain-containing protein [Gammaproteobacteria bacterium]|jgi:arylformamidase|nr:alpha/beta hydrolase fold domain-containing protein [Gammaproteobacteria bacterium]
MVSDINDDPVLCTCENITRSQIIAAIKAGHQDFRRLRQQLNIASECGNCYRPVLNLMRAYAPPKKRKLTMPKDRHFPMPWKHFSHAKLEQEYSPSSCISDIMVYIQQYINDSKQAKQSLQHQANLNFGDNLCQGLDYFPGQPGAPLLVYIHGGYWQELSKNESCFMAPALVALGYHVAVLDYTLAPQASINMMIQQCCQAINWIGQQTWHCNFEQIILSGSSAGAHLAACVLQAAAQGQYHLSANTFAKAILFSGIYDLRPLVGTYINQPLGLDLSQATKLSPGLRHNHQLPPCQLIWGANETAEFKRQSQQYAQFLEADGVSCQTAEITNRNHFDVVYALTSLI